MVGWSVSPRGRIGANLTVPTGEELLVLFPLDAGVITAPPVGVVTAADPGAVLRLGLHTGGADRMPGLRLAGNVTAVPRRRSLVRAASLPIQPESARRRDSGIDALVCDPFESGSRFGSRRGRDSGRISPDPKSSRGRLRSSTCVQIRQEPSVSRRGGTLKSDGCGFSTWTGLAPAHVID
ncbi:hypothetical protein ACQEVZ_54850 [Dactylosporangium sp. CA-152071]|uniref:hypothetical protein n=1 Tax=Dactylosporangium sp. CA-152071 TaxID=3239933 RepID=UPI003D914849